MFATGEAVSLAEWIIDDTLSCKICFFYSHLDWQADYYRSFTQDQRPMGDREEQLEVRSQARPRAVRRGLGGAVEQHNTGRDQDVKAR